MYSFSGTFIGAVLASILAAYFNVGICMSLAGVVQMPFGVYFYYYMPETLIQSQRHDLTCRAICDERAMAT